MSEETKELEWLHSGYTKTGWVSQKDRSNGRFFRSKLREFFITFSDIPKHEAVEWSQEQIADWLDANSVVYQNPSPSKLIIFSEELKVGIGIMFNDPHKKGKIHYSLVHLNLKEADKEE